LCIDLGIVFGILLVISLDMVIGIDFFCVGVGIGVDFFSVGHKLF
jgi:hypothetical protein